MTRDGLQNVVSGMGTGKDKAAHTAHVFIPLTDGEALAAYRSSRLAAKIVDLPAEDAGREWREWQAEAAQISLIEAEETRLGIVGKLIEVLKLARLRRGGAILIGTGDTDTAAPLDPAKIKKGGLRYLTVIPRDLLIAGETQTDPEDPYFNQPKHYTLHSHGQSLVLHPSRLVIFTGRQIPGGPLVGADFWGDGVLQSVLDAVTRDEGGAANAESLTFEAKVDVFKVKDLTEKLRNGGAEFEKLLLQRFQLAQMGKGINGGLMLDSEEAYEQKRASFSGLPDLMDKFAIRVSAAAEIPMTLLYGEAPSGLNANGESSIRIYYDRVKTAQTLTVGPALAILDECIIRSALGDRPAKIHYNWRPLWQPTAKEIAENADRLMSAAEKLDRMGAVSPEAIGKAAVNALTEAGAFPGLESYVAEAGPAPDERDEVEAMGAADALPKTLYVHRPVLNADEIIAWAKEQGFKTTLAADDLHVTIAYSKTPLDWFKAGQAWSDEIEVTKGGPRAMEAFGDAKVLLFSSHHLHWRHHEIIEAGASWDHPEYQPHITISYAEDAPDLSEVEPFKGRILLGPEVFEEIKTDWQEGITEE
ncbi:DUF1073 domain-containing protein [Phaeobacter sp. CNT1-3]|nr:DUF1073 domain-containing protein [Phaeobacter sp. CNT1-3]